MIQLTVCVGVNNESHR